MAKNCISCGKNIGILTVRMALLENDESVICAECFDKMPAKLNELYQGRLFPSKKEILEIKADVLIWLNNRGYNVDTINYITKYLDAKLDVAGNEKTDDNSKIQKICPICKGKMSYDKNICDGCGYDFATSGALSHEEVAKIYNQRQIQYAQNPFYEYDYIVVPNKGNGSTNAEVISKIIQEHAFNGWRLLIMYSNEIRKDKLADFNATMCEDILVFERCIKR